MGRKGEVNLEVYEMIAEALAVDEESYCRIEFTALEYDTSNGSSVYSSLKNGTFFTKQVLSLQCIYILVTRLFNFFHAQLN